MLNLRSIHRVRGRDSGDKRAASSGLRSDRDEGVEMSRPTQTYGTESKSPSKTQPYEGKSGRATETYESGTGGLS